MESDGLGDAFAGAEDVTIITGVTEDKTNDESNRRVLLREATEKLKVAEVIFQKGTRLVAIR